MLPLETVNDIFSFLSSDFTTLKKCHPLFPDIVERWLYASINLDNSGNVEESGGERSDNGLTIDTLSFALVLLDKPHVADYVRRVRIVLPAVLCGRMHASLVLSALSKITSITLCWGDPRLPSSEVSWTSLNETFREVVASRLRLPSIKEVTLPRIPNFPISLFDDCKGIELLSVQGLLYPFNFEFFPRLRSLGITYQADIAQSWGSDSTLRSLSLDFYAHFKDEDEYITFPRIIQSCSTTLVNLGLDFRNFQGSLVTLPALPALQHLTICTSVTFNYQSLTQSSSLEYALSLLRSLPDSSFAPGHVRLSLHAYFETTLPSGVLMESSGVLTAIIRTPGFLHPINLIIHVVRNMVSFPNRYRDIYRGSVDMPIIREDFELKRLVDEGQVIVTVVIE